MDFFTQVREQLGRVWNQLNMQQKMMFISAPVLLVVTMAIAVYVAGRPQMVTLVTGQNLAEIASIKDYLDAQSIPYEIVDEKTIRVDKSIRPGVMMDLAKEGLIGYEAGPGYELFDQTRFGMTDRMFTLNEKRAMENNLAKIIVSGNTNISEAHVTLDMPKDALFTEDQEEPSASVKIVGKGSVSQESVEGIQRLVAASVPKLKPENVVVLDKNNKLLSADSDLEPGVKTAYKHMQIQLAIESLAKRKVESILTAVVGPDNYVVTVNVTLDWEKKNIENVHLDANSPVTVSSKIYEEKTDEKGIAGPPGVVSNVQDTGIGTEGQTSSSSITEEIQNFQHPWWHTLIEEDQGELTDLSVSVMLNHHYDAESNLVAWTPQELLDLERQLRVASGMSLKTGAADPQKFDIQTWRFDDTHERKIAREQMMATVMSILRSLIPLILLFAIGYFAYIFFQRAFAAPEVAEEITEEIPIEPVSEAKELTLAQLGLAEFGDIASLPAEEQRRIKMQEHVINYAAEKPEEVAAIIKAWLSS